MTTRSITIDAEAYKCLTKARREGESWSSVIKRVALPPVDAAGLIRRMQANALSRRALAAVESRVARRSKPSSRER